MPTASQNVLINAYKTLRRRVVYRWHPMFGEEVSVHVGAGARKHGMLHCDVSGKFEVAGLAIPIWMFDPSICQRMQLRRDPFVDISALEALKQLFVDTIGCSKTKGVTDEQSQSSKKGKAAGDRLVVSKRTGVGATAVGDKERNDASIGRDANRNRRKNARHRKERGQDR